LHYRDINYLYGGSFISDQIEQLIFAIGAVLLHHLVLFQLNNNVKNIGRNSWRPLILTTTPIILFQGKLIFEGLGVLSSKITSAVNSRKLFRLDDLGQYAKFKQNEGLPLLPLLNRSSLQNGGTRPVLYRHLTSCSKIR
jgi:hypothetical protein